MKRHFLHSALTIFTLCVMTLTSTGFTAVVGYCSMTHEAMCCCEESSSTPESPLPGGSITDAVVSCYTQTIAGGLNEITATIYADVFAHAVVLDVIPVDPFALNETKHDRPFHFTTDETAAPPGVPIYKRVNSFLI